MPRANFELKIRWVLWRGFCYSGKISCSCRVSQFPEFEFNFLVARIGFIGFKQWDAVYHGTRCFTGQEWPWFPSAHFGKRMSITLYFRSPVAGCLDPVRFCIGEGFFPHADCVWIFDSVDEVSQSMDRIGDEGVFEAEIDPEFFEPSAGKYEFR